MKPMSRRVLMCGALKAAACISVPSELLISEPLVSVIGIQLYTVDQDLKANTRSTLDRVRKIGYREVETAGFAGLSAKDFRAALRSADLSCRSSHFFDFGKDNLDQIIEAAHDLGVRYIVSSAMSQFAHARSGGPMTADDFKAMGDFCNQIGRRAQQAGLQFAYHNHNSEFQDVGPALGYEVLLESTDPDLVKFELDCGWMMAAGQDPITYFKRYPTRYRMVHVKDFVKPRTPTTSPDPKQIPQGTILGTGYIDYLSILAAAKNAGVEHFYVEQEPPFIGTTAIEAATKDYQYLHSLSK